MEPENLFCRAVLGGYFEVFEEAGGGERGGGGGGKEEEELKCSNFRKTSRK
jgi:hypothetical protein